MGYGKDKDSASSITQSGVGTSNITVTDNDKQQELTGQTAEEAAQSAITDITTETVADNSGALANIFDKDKVQAEIDLQVKVTQQFDRTRQDMKQIINKKIDEYKDADPEKAKDWQNAGLLLDMLAGGLSSPGDGLLGSLSGAANPLVAQTIKGLTDGTLDKGGLGHILAHGIAGAAMAAANGGDLLSGALTAGGAEALAPIIAEFLYGKEAKDLTADEKNTLSAIIGILGTGAGALTGDSAIDAVIGDSVASNAVENNYLKKDQVKKLHQEYWTLGLSEDDADKIIEKYKALSHLQDEELISICSNSPSSVQCTQLIKESLDYNGGVWGPGEKVREDLLGDQALSSALLLDLLFNGKEAQEYFKDRIDTIDDRANFFGINSDYYSGKGIDIRWFGVAEDVSRDFLTGLGADGYGSYASFWVGNFVGGGSLSGGGSLYDWREEAGNALIGGGFNNFKDAFNNQYQSTKKWDMDQLKGEQKVLDPIHNKYLNDWGLIRLFAIPKGIDNIKSYDDRVQYGCEQMGYCN